MGITRQVTVNSSGQTQVTAQTVCRKVRVAESASVANWPTTAYNIYKPVAGSTANRVPQGEGYEFRALHFFQPNDPICFIETVTGSTTFDIDEE